MSSERFEEEFASAGVPNSDRGISSRDKGPSSAELAILQRRELALTATDSVAEVLGVDVTIPMLQVLADEKEKTPTRLAAVRALRCIESIAREDSKVMAQIPEKDIYHFVEGAITYGASESCFLGLVTSLAIPAEKTTGLYAVREMVSEYADGKPGFRTMLAALQTIGISPSDAANDPEGAVRALEEAEYFVGYVGLSERGGRIFNHPIFAPHLKGADVRIIEDDPDGSISKGSLEAQKAFFSQTPEEDEGEIETVDIERTASDIRTFFRNNGL